MALALALALTTAHGTDTAHTEVELGVHMTPEPLSYSWMRLALDENFQLAFVLGKQRATGWEISEQNTGT
jgi:hypothetical protein